MQLKEAVAPRCSLLKFELCTSRKAPGGRSTCRHESDAGGWALQLESFGRPGGRRACRYEPIKRPVCGRARKHEPPERSTCGRARRLEPMELPRVGHTGWLITIGMSWGCIERNPACVQSAILVQESERIVVHILAPSLHIHRQSTVVFGDILAHVLR